MTAPHHSPVTLHLVDLDERVVRALRAADPDAAAREMAEAWRDWRASLG